MATKIIQIEHMKCEKCRMTTIHEVKINEETKKVTDIQCYRCKHGADFYGAFESVYDIGVRFRLGIK